ncbi:hypothetical protein [Lysinibacillus sphaericus]|uniref:Uncharacterized protein n=1 Tax=Lysinibacillus sphaericus TaxID=1421 RepID=A0A6H0A0F7_LYSSH|nr:hypothetical protein [Lysinibacillus sphaericus]QIS31170.1 hypothetical protein [Lysinibacillus sphaericus]QPA61280.1 hypothetical protein INQ55_23385 [Lysinibacillus sphaericus]
MEDTAQFDIKIGENEVCEFKWGYLNFMDARLAILSKDSNPKLVNYLKTELKKRNSQILHISSKDNVEWIADTWSIKDFEGIPSEEVTSLFAQHRNKWVQLYLDYICWAHKENRYNLIKAAAYEAHKEGPLFAYIKGLETVENEKHREILTEAFKKLENVNWKRSNEGFHFVLDTTCPVKFVESLIIGVWSAWIFTVCIDEPLHITHLVELELDKLFNLPLTLDNEERAFIERAMYLLSQLTYDYLCSTISVTPTLFPAVEMQCDHIIADHTDIIDFDLYSHLGALHGNEFIWKYKEEYRKLNFTLEHITAK